MKQIYQKELNKIFLSYKFSLYEFNTDETGNLILEDGLTYAIKDKFKIEVTFSVADIVESLSYTKYIGDEHIDYVLNENISTTTIHNFIEFVIEDIDYMIEYLHTFNDVLETINLNFDHLKTLGFYLTVDLTHFIIDIKHDSIFNNFSITYDPILQNLKWCDGQIIEPETNLLDYIIKYAKSHDMWQYKFLYDSNYTQDTVTAVLICNQFLDDVRRDRNSNQGITYGGLISNYFELKDIPNDFHNLIDELNSRTYTKEELIKYGYFDLDKYGHPIYKDCIQ